MVAASIRAGLLIWPRPGSAVSSLFSFDLPVYYSPKAWRGRIRASAGVAASLDAETVARFDAALAALLQTNFPGPQLLTPHRVFAVWGRKYPAE